MNNDRIYIGNIHTRLDDRSGDQHINLPFNKGIHDLFQLMFLHLSMGKCNICLRYQFLDPMCHLCDSLYPVIDIVDLSLSCQFPADGSADHLFIIFTHIGLDRHTVNRRFFQHAHVADPCQTHMKRSWNRRRT